jgi:hypothetical protein
VVLILAQAQAQMPPTEMTEVAGFTGTKGTIGPQFDQFDDGLGTSVPPPDASGYRNDPIRHAVLARLNASPEYWALFGRSFPSVAHGEFRVASGDPIISLRKVFLTATRQHWFHVAWSRCCVRDRMEMPRRRWRSSARLG